MANLTRKQRASLESVLYHIKRAEKYLYSPDTAIARRSHGTTTLDYVRADGKALYEVDKEIGSDLCGIRDAIQYLERFLYPPAIEGYPDLSGIERCRENG